MKKKNNVTKKKLSKLLNDPEFIDKMIEFFGKNYGYKERHIKRVEMLFNNEETFGELIQKVINKHNVKYYKSFDKKHILPHSSNLLYSIFNLAMQKGKKVDSVCLFTEMFPSQLVEYNGWVFAITHGQGSVCSVYKDGKLMYRD